MTGEIKSLAELSGVRYQNERRRQDPPMYHESMMMPDTLSGRGSRGTSSADDEVDYLRGKMEKTSLEARKPGRRNETKELDNGRPKKKDRKALQGSLKTDVQPQTWYNETMTPAVDDQDFSGGKIDWLRKNIDGFYIKRDYEYTERSVKMILNFIEQNEAGGNGMSLVEIEDKFHWTLILTETLALQDRLDDALAVVNGISAMPNAEYTDKALRSCALIEEWRGFLYHQLGDYDSAKLYLKKAIKIWKEVDPFDGINEAVRIMIRILEDEDEDEEEIELGFYRSMISPKGQLQSPYREDPVSRTFDEISISRILLRPDRLDIGPDGVTIEGSIAKAKKAVLRTIQNEDWELADVLFDDESILKLDCYKPEGSRRSYRPLQAAVMLNKLEMVRIILEKDPDLLVDGTDKDVMDLAVEHADADILECLLEAGGSPDGYNDLPLLHLAVIHKLDEDTRKKIALLIESGAEINLKDKWGKTPLLVAAGTDRHGRRGRAWVFEELIKHGADVNATGRDGNTPLHEAANSGFGEEELQVLMDHGANLRAKNKLGRQPKDMTESNRRFLTPADDGKGRKSILSGVFSRKNRGSKVVVEALKE
ncbi:hypothetical protein H072_3413 [Dactylellina haptotyla CBS 200.50]|uniref:Uncharacterized protein n=1 Tax=Dactylellina haptotyla (strain CBS 200.50) TaxID=1284197 RepID=S8C4M4_DACHA|nr:hypothetical protein H072_3413 [Dactylellina haptotyla CBS 200.50]